MSASPSADLQALAAKAYLALATKTNAEITALGSLSPGASLRDVTAYYASLAKIQADAITGLQAISFPPRLKDDVENLVRAAGALQKVETDIATSASLAQVTSRNARLADALASMTKAANTLRTSLGLEPIATPPPPPTLAPTARPSGVAVSDPATGMKIGSPYTLEPMDAQTTAQFQAQITAALGTLASSFQFGLRWVDVGDQHIALVMVIEVPGAGAVVTSPEFLTQMAAGMARVSTSDVVDEFDPRSSGSTGGQARVTDRDVPARGGGRGRRRRPRRDG